MHDFTTPMMQQYMEVKKHYPDCLLFFRMGDFYELFLEDAEIGAKALDITLTSRARGQDGRIPMAGVPYHAVDSYLAKLIKSGFKVAICEQVSLPDGKGLVDRKVIRIVTPGTVLDDQSLIQKENNYIMSLFFQNKTIGFALADLTTGHFHMTQFDEKDETMLDDEIVRLRPSECVLFDEQYNDPAILGRLSQHDSLNINAFGSSKQFKMKARDILSSQFGRQLELFDVSKDKRTVYAAGLLLQYLQYTQKSTIPHFKTITHIPKEHHMYLDRATIINLELFSTIRNRETRGSLIQFLDRTATAMGGRKLRTWLKSPLIEKREILKRHDAVDELFQHRQFRHALREQLRATHDVERTIARISLEAGNARDLVSLKDSLIHIFQIKKIIAQAKSPLLTEIYEAVDEQIKKIITHIDSHIVDEPPFDLKEGGLIKEGVNPQLDTLRLSIGKDKEWLQILEKEEQQKTGISSLKVKFNSVFGYYIEVSKSNLHLVPNEYIRKQTLVNGERYITQELKEREESILTGESKTHDIEYSIFCQVRTWVVDRITIIQKAADAIAALDCLLTFADIAEQEQFVRPILTDSQTIDIKAGRHPVVESLFEDKQFVPNDVFLDDAKHQLTIITGPNMAGKSVFLRQVATVVLLNQIGSFVPAREASLCVVDRIFVRSGASDMIADGLSTFMVEMVESAQILHKATSKSLVVMDEIGRGTSTYDGISIAWAVAEHLVTATEKPKTLFATHYHELQDLEDIHPDRISNAHMAVADQDGEPVFLYTIQTGAASHSYGVAVAKQAGLPESVIDTAWKKLHELETGEKRTKKQSSQQPVKQKESNVEKIVKRLDVNTITPLDAINILSELKKTV